ncbi:MAG: hypothetical protein ABSF25_09175 [Bryobacteraceae bacterium]
MKTSPKNGRKKPLYGPNIVRAWFDTVFHYALRGLEHERNFLERRNWTYRFHLDALEYLAPLAEHLPGSARDNLEQFLSFFPAIRILIDEHNYGTARLARTCSEFHAALLASPRFDEVYASVEAEAPVKLDGEFRSHFGAFSTKDHFRGLLAEYLVNNIRENPGYYTTARLWKRYSEQFFSVLDEPGLASHRQAADACGHGLSEAVVKLAGRLKESRSDLSLKFDVPIAVEMTSAD